MDPTTPGTGNLFRKYLTVFIVLVGSSLLVSSAVELGFSYRENQANLLDLQHRDARMAAATIERFVEDILLQLDWAMPASALAQSPGDETERLDNYYRLLKQAPAITTVSHLDPS